VRNQARSPLPLVRFRESCTIRLLREMRRPVKGGGLSLAGLALTLHLSRLLHPKRLVEKILTFKSALEGERKQVTVLFADLRGSMRESSPSAPKLLVVGAPV